MANIFNELLEIKKYLEENPNNMGTDYRNLVDRLIYELEYYFSTNKMNQQVEEAYKMYYLKGVRTDNKAIARNLSTQYNTVRSSIYKYSKGIEKGLFGEKISEFVYLGNREVLIKKIERINYKNNPLKIDFDFSELKENSSNIELIPEKKKTLLLLLTLYDDEIRKRLIAEIGEGNIIDVINDLFSENPNEINSYYRYLRKHIWKMVKDREKFFEIVDKRVRLK